MEAFSYNDQPISEPNEDRFGVNPFALALANSIRKLKNPKGSVIAMNGPWGSGKSSAVNLLRHHLAPAVSSGEMAIINFDCWWFRGEDALALAFFRELYAGLSPSLGEKVLKALPKLAARLLRAGPALGGAADSLGAGGAGSAAGVAMEWIGGLIAQDESVEKLHGELSEALLAQKKRFLVVIDDIDRLSPDEALLIFRMVKSVGRLPNVMYLLVYDRQLAEKIVSERYPSEGPHYLEKIVQAAFELPEPAAIDVQQHLLDLIGSICGGTDEDMEVRFMNIFYEMVAPEMRTPRDVARFTNSLTVTWPAVAGEVDVADFVALEVFRLLHPDLYRAIRQNKELLTVGPSGDARDRELQKIYFNDLFLGSVSEPTRGRLRNGLMRLFPVLERTWAGMGYGDGFSRQWARERRVCIAVHFDSYFRFAIGDDVLSRAELDTLIERANDRGFVMETFTRATAVKRKAGGTKAAVLLEQLNTNANRVAKENVLPLLSALFEIADSICVEADQAGAFGIANNERRLLWLLRSLTSDCMSLQERSEILINACENAAVGWLAALCSSAWADYHPREGTQSKQPEQCLMTEVDASHLRKMLFARIEVAASDGSLVKNSSLAYLLYTWDSLAVDDRLTVKRWTESIMTTDEGVKYLASAFTSYSWSQGVGGLGLGDIVAKRSTRAQIQNIDKLMDVAIFRQRVEEVAAGGTMQEVAEFLAAWQQFDRGEDD